MTSSWFGFYIQQQYFNRARVKLKKQAKAFIFLFWITFLMSWIELHIKTNASHADQISDQLMLLGAQAVTFQDAGDQPIFEPKPGEMHLWQETIVIGLFDLEIQLKSIVSYFEEQQAQGLIKNFHIQHIADQDWERVCLEYYQPIQCGKRLWICPSWRTPPDKNAINVILDPGLAFGTGTHPTTALCLQWLDEHVKSPELVIDYGCGSGILGLAALKLGAKQVIAVDYDPQALEATQNNCARNHISSPVLTTYLPQDLPKNLPKADLLIANILAQPLLELAELFANLLHPNGKILLSGILLDQRDQIKYTYAPWFDQLASENQGDWVRITGVRK